MSDQNDNENDSEGDTPENPYRIGDPVLDLAQGQSMVVVNAPDQTVREWSDENNYNLTENYGNEKLGATEVEQVVECVYTGNLRNEPSKTYTFPTSRVRLIDVHHADGGARIYDRVVRDALESIFVAAAGDSNVDARDLLQTVYRAGVADCDVVDEAYELADVAIQFDAKSDSDNPDQ